MEPETFIPQRWMQSDCDNSCPNNAAITQLQPYVMHVGQGLYCPLLCKAMSAVVQISLPLIMWLYAPEWPAAGSQGTHRCGRAGGTRRNRETRQCLAAHRLPPESDRSRAVIDTQVGHMCNTELLPGIHEEQGLLARMKSGFVKSLPTTVLEA